MIAINLAELSAADAYCRKLVQHYENFTVASRLTPRRLRRDLTRVYAFCRTTDDIGDETGDRALAIDRLERWKWELQGLFEGALPTHPVLIALAPTLRVHNLEAGPFLDLIEANVRDQWVDSYDDWPALLQYCRLSAAPVGRIVLQLFGVDDLRAKLLSDDVCIGLQLANFAQDVRDDAARGRTYLLQTDLRRLGSDGAVCAMCDRARSLLSSGRWLEGLVAGRLRLQLTLYRLGGEAILDAISAAEFQTSEVRPAVRRRSRVGLLLRAVGTSFLRGHPQPVGGTTEETEVEAAHHG